MIDTCRVTVGLAFILWFGVYDIVQERTTVKLAQCLVSENVCSRVSFGSCMFPKKHSAYYWGRLECTFPFEFNDIVVL